MLHEKLECYRRAVRLAEELSKGGARWPKGLGYLLDQQRRAMASVVLNTAEGNARRSHAERRRFFEIARASASEVAACVDLMFAFGLIREERALSLKSRLSEVSKMLWGLMRWL
ncbi:MAG: four helix bundle protein [Proteobacteria bacterium]|nr:four helix bundle protein [Pseudomonadota bacterium]